MGRPGLGVNPKFRRLSMVLGSRATARGSLELLWETGYESGNDEIGDVVDVELACDWHGEPGTLCDALLECGGNDKKGFLEPIPEKPGRFRIHDLFDHAPRYVNDRVKRELEREASGKTISQLRSEAGRRGAEEKWAKQNREKDGKQMANEIQVLGCDGKWIANDATPVALPLPPHPIPPLKPSCPKLRFDEEDHSTASWMLAKILEVLPGLHQPNLDKWANEIRLMRERDRRTYIEIREVFSWANADSFWKSNILSPEKFRDKFNQLLLKSKEPTHATRKARFPTGPGQCSDPGKVGVF